MATKYWIKLFHEILHDPKMGRLPDNLWRRFIECCLFAGELNQGGRLPPLSDISWVVQEDEETLQSEFDQLARFRLLDYRADELFDGYWNVVNFDKRQKAMTKAEYMRRKRKEDQLLVYYQPSDQPVTNGNTDKDKDKDKDGDKEKEAATAIIHTFYENNFQTITPHIAEKINDEIDESPPSWIMEAMQIAVERGKRSWGYVAGILRNWHTKGKDSGRLPPTDEPAGFAAIRAYKERMNNG